jgi:NADPH2:quinone reductase
MRAIELTAFGATDGLRLIDAPEPVPRSGEVLIDVRRAGVNYADLSRREGRYDRRFATPLVLGAEVAGTRRDTGERVVALTGGYGGYAEVVAVDEALVFPVPDGLGDDEAITLLLQGLTAFHVLRTSAQLEYGDTVVVHAAAGGVGSLIVQLALLWGAGRVIGVASSAAKRARVLALGADAAVDGAPAGLADRIRIANGGKPVDVIAEMVGGAVFEASLRTLSPSGRLVVFGAAGGTPSASGDPRVVAFSLPALFAARPVRCARAARAAARGALRDRPRTPARPRGRRDLRARGRRRGARRPRRPAHLRQAPARGLSGRLSPAAPRGSARPPRRPPARRCRSGPRPRSAPRRARRRR